MKTTSSPLDAAAKSLTSVLLVVGLVVVFVTVGFFFLTQLENPIKQIDVSTLEGVTLRNPRNGVTKSVEPQRWSTMVDYFKSSSRVTQPANAEILAEVLFHFADGRVQAAEVLDMGREVGCFKINSVYYQGGDERELIRMLDDELRYQQEDLSSPRQR